MDFEEVIPALQRVNTKNFVIEEEKEGTRIFIKLSESLFLKLIYENHKNYISIDERISPDDVIFLEYHFQHNEICKAFNGVLETLIKNDYKTLKEILENEKVPHSGILYYLGKTSTFRITHRDTWGITSIAKDLTGNFAKQYCRMYGRKNGSEIFLKSIEFLEQEPNINIKKLLNQLRESIPFEWEGFKNEEDFIKFSKGIKHE